MWTFTEAQFNSLHVNLFAQRSVGILRQLYPSLDPLADASTLDALAKRMIPLIETALQADKLTEPAVFAWLHCALVFGTDFEATLPGLAAKQSGMAQHEREALLNAAAYQSLAALGATRAQRADELRNAKANPLTTPTLFPPYWGISNEKERLSARDAMKRLLAAGAQAGESSPCDEVLHRSLLDRALLFKG